MRRAQDEYADNLRTFPDVASQHTSLGWLLAARGDLATAERELRLAVSLDAQDPRPHVYLGVLAARARRFDAAIAHWKDAQRRNPEYPNLDRLMAEARAHSPGH